MHTIELTDDELRIVRRALHSFLNDFGHDEQDVVAEIKRVLAKLPTEAGGRPGESRRPLRGS